MIELPTDCQPESGREAARSVEMHDMLDKILDGEPILIVFTPSLRRDLRRRALERAREDRDARWPARMQP